VGESSDESSSSSSDESSGDEGDGRARRVGGGGKKEGGGGEDCGHGHKHGKRREGKRKPSPNAYERMPKYDIKSLKQVDKAGV
jgi:protein phosphatase 1 regulatory subunit 11